MYLLGFIFRSTQRHQGTKALRVFALLLALIMGSLPVVADNIVSQESFARQVKFQGQASDPIVISPPAKLKLSPNTEKLVVIPEKLDIKDEIQEFRMFRNRYVIFGVYLSLALYYNWLTRHR